MRERREPRAPEYKGLIIRVAEWRGESHGWGNKIVYEPHPNDSVDVLMDGKTREDRDFIVSCYRFQVDESGHGLTMSQALERAMHLVER
jgi:hypothetical protein